MKFTKTAVAVAIAGLAAAPMMASAETTLSGLVQLKYQGSDVDVGGEAADDGDLEMAAGDVRVAINSQNEIVGGLTGYGNIQFNLDDLTGEGGDLVVQLEPQEDESGLPIDGTAGTVAADNIYVGVKGGFGDVRFGEIPLAIEYGQLANDIFDIGATVVDGASYVGAFGPVGLIANYALEAPDSDMAGVGAKFALGGVTVGLGYELRNLSDDEVGNAAIGASFAIAGFSVAAHYALLENTLDQAGITFPDEVEAGDSDATVVAVQVGYGIAGVNLGLTYQFIQQDDFDFDLSSDGGVPLTGEATDVERSVIRFDAGYDLGGGMDISTRISVFSGDGDFDVDVSEIGNDDFVDDDLTEYRVQLTKTF